MKSPFTSKVRKAIAFLAVVFSVFFLSSCQKYPPTVKTVSAVATTSTVITAAGQVTDDGDADVFSYGICLSTNSLPTISDTKKECSSTNGNSTSDFKAVFTDLEINATYYLRAYAINCEGIAYGEVLNLKTSAKALATVFDATLVTRTEATLNATVNPLNSTTENWFEYWANGEALKKVALPNASGNGEVTRSIKVSDLTPGKTYSFLLKAKNEFGEAASLTLTFETYAVADYDGNLYHSVTIGTQTWLRENFRGTHYANGDPIANVTNADTWSTLTTGAYCWYNNDSELGKVYGGLYNWYVGADARGLIVGWHTPTSDEWPILRHYLGDYLIAGPKVMEAGHDHWSTTSQIATNSSGFTALPNGGIALDVSSSKFIFMSLGEVATFWHSDAFGPGATITKIESANCGLRDDTIYDKKYGLGLRLMKN